MSVPYFPQTLAANTVVGRLGSNGPTEAIPISILAQAVLTLLAGEVTPGPGNVGVWKYSDSTGDADPGDGYVRFNNLALGSATQIYLDNENIDGSDLSSWIETWDTYGITGQHGVLFAYSRDNPTTKFGIYTISGIVVDGTGYRKVGLTPISAAGTLTVDEQLIVTVVHAGPEGIPGPVGGAQFLFDSATADADPGSGEFRLNNADPTLATALYVSDFNTGGVSVESYLQTFDDFGNSTVRGVLLVFDLDAPDTNFRYYTVSGSVTDASPYQKITIAHVSGGGSFTAGTRYGFTYNYRGVAGAGLANVVDDTTPELGGTLGLNGQNVTGVGNLSPTGNVDALGGGKIKEAGVNISPIGLQGEYYKAAEWCPTITNGAGRSYNELATNDLISETLDFDTTTQEFATLEVVPPKKWNAGTVTFRYRWRATGGSAAQTVDMGLSAVAISNDDVEDAAPGTVVVVTDALIATGDHHTSDVSAAVTIAGTPAKADKVVFKLQRNVANDNLAADAMIEGVEIFWTLDAATDV